MKTQVVLTVALLVGLSPWGGAQEVEKTIRRDQAEPAPPKTEDSAPILVLETGGFTGMVFDLSFSPDGRYLAGAGADRTVRIWDLQSGELRHVLRGQTGAGTGQCYAVAFSPSGRELVVGTFDPTNEGVLRVYRTSDLSQVAEVLPGPKGAVNRLAFSRDGMYLAALDREKVIVWNWSTRRQQCVITPKRPIRYLGFPESLPLLAGANFQDYFLWNAIEGRESSLSDLTDQQRSAGFLSKVFTQFPFGGSSAPAYRIYRLDRGLALLGGSSLKAMDGKDHYWTGLWSAGQDGPVSLYEGHQYLITAVALNEDATLAASADDLGEVHVWETQTGRRRFRFQGKGSAIYRVAWDATGGRLALGRTPDPKGTWNFNHYAALEKTFDLATHSLSEDISGDHRLEVTSQGDRTLRLTSSQAGRYSLECLRRGTIERQIDTDKVGMGLFDCFSFLRPKGRNFEDPVIVGTELGQVFCLDPRAKKPPLYFLGHSGMVTSLSESPDGRLLATSSTDGTTRLWKLDVLKPRFEEYGYWDFVLNEGPGAEGDYGETVVMVPPDSHAEKAGIQVGDRFLGIGGIDRKSLMKREMQSTYPFRAGQQAMVDMERDGKPFKVELTLIPSSLLFYVPLLNIYLTADGQDWVIWTPRGYYDSSLGGDRLIGWHINQGPDKAAKFYLAQQFRKQFYRPDVIDRILKEADIDRGVELANTARPQGAESLDLREAGVLRRLEPPVVRLVAPSQGLRTSEEKVTVRAEITAQNDLPIRDITILLNGRPPASDVRRESSGTDRQQTIVQEVPLLPGRNEIAVIASNRASDSQPVRAEVERVATEAAMIKPTLYLLAVGVSKYANKEFELQFADRDAVDLGSAWKRQEGALYSKVEVRLLTDAEATARNILNGMDWLAQSTTQHDVAMLFLSAHDYRDQRDGYYLVPHDFDPVHLRSTAVSYAEIHHLVKDVAGKFLLFIDTCHSGGPTGSGRKGTVFDDPLKDLVSDNVGAIVYSSSTHREFSLENPKWGHGAFTKALLDTLASPESDLDHNGYLTTDELDFQLTNRVKQLTEGRQHPVTEKPSTVYDFPIARLGKPGDSSAKDIIRVAPDEAEAYNARGLAALRRDDLDQAIDEFTEAIRRNPKLASAYSRRAIGFAQKGDFIRAVADIDEAVGLDPDAAETLLCRGMVSWSAGRAKDALDDLSRAIARDPKLARAYAQRGIYLSARGKRSQALADYDEAIRLDPLYARAFGRRGLLRAALGDLDQAQADLNEAVRLAPDDSSGFYNRALFRLNNRKDPDAALADLTEAIRVNPKDSNAYLERGFVYAERHALDKAISDYTEAIKLNPLKALAYSNRGGIYRVKRNWKLAAADLTEAVRLVPRNSVTHYSRGLLFEAMGKPHWALADFEAAVRLDPKNAEARFQRGLNYEDAKADCERAIADFNEVMLLTGKTARLYNARGYAYYHKGDYQQGISDLEEAIRLDPKWTLAHRNLGWFLATCPEERVRDGKKAVEHARRACELSEWKDWNAIHTLAAACAENGEFDEAVRWAKQAESMAPEASKVHPRTLLALFESRKPFHVEDVAFDRGRTLLLQGDYDQAIASFDLALQRHGPRPGLCYINRGLAHRIKGDHDRAIDDMRQGLRLEPNNAFFNETLAQTHFMRSQSVAQKGDYERAIADLRQAVELKPEVVEYQAHLCLYLAACPKAELRNGQQAVEHATRACELTQWKESRSLRMLAVAHAEAGRFDEAIRWAQEASRLTPEAQRALDDQLLQLFQARKPFRLPDAKPGQN